MVEKIKSDAPGLPREQPGALRSEIAITLQTRHAQKLVEGRKRSKGVEPIIGLLEFGRRTKLIWLSAEANDPFADWYLLQIETELESVKRLIKDKIAWLKGVMDDMEGIVINVAESIQPIQVPIFFQNPYGYMGAYLIVDYDILARTMFTARHIGLLDRMLADRLMHEVSTAIRRVFNLSTQWKFTGVTREDMAQNTQNAQRAEAAFGYACPEEVVTGKVRPKRAPLLKQKVSVTSVDTSSDAAGTEGVSSILAFG